MDAGPQAYHRVERKQFPQSVRKVTPEHQYWNTFKSKYQDVFHPNIPFLRFGAAQPFDCVVCSNYDVRIFRSSTFQTHKKLGFKLNPLCADLRRDTKLLAVGGKRGLLRIYNNTPTSGLQVTRALPGHFSDVYDIKFQPTDTTRLASFPSDKTVGYWDIISATQLNSIKGHSDFIRCGDWLNHYNNENSQHCIISGSYDHLCKLWDLRDIKTINNDDNSFENRTRYDNTIIHKCELQFDHGLPIESCLSIPNSDLIAIAGGPKVTVWSIRKPNSPLTTISVHRKSVTCLTTNKSGTRLLTGCLDNYVRVFTTSATGILHVFDVICLSDKYLYMFVIKQVIRIFKNTHAFSIPSAILSLDMCVNDMLIAVGTLKME